MTILFAGNRPADFELATGGMLTTTPGRFDAAYVPNAIFYTADVGDVLDFIFDTPQSVIWVHYVTRISATGGNYHGYNEEWMRFYDTNGLRMGGLYRGGTISNANATRVQGDTTVLGLYNDVDTALVTWDVCFERTATDLICTQYKNGVSISTATAAFGTRTNIKRLQMIVQGMRYNLTGISFSEIIVANTSTLGMRLYALPPSTVGSLTDMVGDVSDLLTIGEGLGLTSDAPNERHTWNPAAYTGPTKDVAAVLVNFSAERVGGSPSTIASMLRKSGLNYDGANQEILTASRRQQIWHTNPITGLPWHSSDLSGLEFGLKSGA